MLKFRKFSISEFKCQLKQHLPYIGNVSNNSKLFIYIITGFFGYTDA